MAEGVARTNRATPSSFRRRARRRPSDVEVRRELRVGLDEHAAGLHLVTHQHGEHPVGFNRIFNLHAQEPAHLGVRQFAETQRVQRRHRPRAYWTMRIGIGVLVFYACVALLSLVWTPYDPLTPGIGDGYDAPSLAFPLGTDRLGRDNLSRIILGARVSIVSGVVAVGIAAFVGTVLGLISGYLGRWIDALVMRTADAMLSFPLILIALLFAVTLGPSFANLIIVLALVMWARFARLVRGETLAWKERDFVALARIAGCSPLRILTRHIFPNVLNALVVLATLQIGWVIIVEASLSFLGAGVPPPDDEEEVIGRIRDALKSVRYGYIEIIVQNSRVVQLDITRKIRFDKTSRATIGRWIKDAVSRGCLRPEGWGKYRIVHKPLIA